MARRSTVNMKDVAALVGVSVGTLSNVLNSPDLVSPNTAAMVQAAIDKLGRVRTYRPAAAGRAEVTDRVRGAGAASPTAILERAGQNNGACSGSPPTTRPHKHERAGFTPDLVVRRSTARARDQRKPRPSNPNPSKPLTCRTSAGSSYGTFQPVERRGQHDEHP